MSEIMLNILDGERAVHSRVHGSEGDRIVAALAADPETIAPPGGPNPPSPIGPKNCGICPPPGRTSTRSAQTSSANSTVCSSAAVRLAISTNSSRSDKGVQDARRDHQ